MEQEKLYTNNLKVSVAILRKLSDEWKGQPDKATEPGALQSLKMTLNNFLKKAYRHAMIVRR
ncbi:hypothetical protein SAY87_000217 [Trapa incisa]|uniref:Uncharacterized protein n=1 Tax=Trapa incisa TaxID=236973 RepID=A0AAN7GEZ3_9MYRT|nr:hypothetical protein SAY87_000217 [Trapa incisa]